MSQSRVTIRMLARCDLAATKRLCSGLFPEARSKLGYLDKCVGGSGDSAGNLAFIAKHGNRVVGIAWCQIDVLARHGVAMARVHMVAVSARMRRRGVATRLWRRMEAKLKKLGVSAAWTRSGVLGSGIDIITYPDAVVFFLNMGFEKREDIYDMEARLGDLDCDTARAEARLRREGIEIRRIEYRERPALERFLSPLFPQWLATADAVTPHGPQWVHIARTARKVIGFAASYGAEFGPMGVEPRHRLKGIGKVLLLRSLRDIRERGHSTALIGWANFPFYAKAINAPVTRVMWQMEKRL